MFTGKTVFAQLMLPIPRRDFNACVARYKGDYRSRNLSCYDQFLVMCLAQYASKNSLRDIEASLIAVEHKLYHSGISYAVPRNTLAKANEQRGWRIYRDFGQALIKRVRPLYAEDPFRLDIDNMVYAIDSSTISLCLKLCPWAKFRTTKAGIISDEVIKLTGVKPSKCYPETLRMLINEDVATGKIYRFQPFGIRDPDNRRTLQRTLERRTVRDAKQFTGSHTVRRGTRKPCRLPSTPRSLPSTSSGHLHVSKGWSSRSVQPKHCCTTLQWWIDLLQCPEILRTCD